MLWIQFLRLRIVLVRCNFCRKSPPLKDLRAMHCNAEVSSNMHRDPCWMGLTRARSHILEKKGEFYEISSWVEIWHWIGVGLHMAWKSVYGLHFMWYGCFVWQYLCLVRLCAWRCMSRLTLDRLEAWRMRRRVVSTLSHPPASCRCSTMLRSSPSGGGTTTLIP